MIRYPALLAIITGIAGSTHAAPVFDGLWASNPDSCNAANTDMVPMQIIGDIIQHYESRCKIANPLLIPGMNGQVFDLVCAGEGEEWTSRGLLLLNEDDSIVYSHDGWSVIMYRCS